MLRSAYTPKLKSLWLLIIVGLLCSSVAYSDTLRVGFGSQRPPYVIDEENRGIEVDIVRVILSRIGHQVEPVYLSNNALHLSFDTHNLDVSTSVRGQYDFKDLYYSSPYIQYHNVAISLAERALDIRTVQDLDGYRVGAWQLARGDLGDEFKGLADKLGGRYFEYENQRLQNEAFWAGKLDIIIIDKSIFFWNKMLLDADLDTQKEVSIHPLFPPRTEFRVAFKNEAMRDDFNRVLKLIKKSGEYDAIVKRYIQE